MEAQDMMEKGIEALVGLISQLARAGATDEQIVSMIKSQMPSDAKESFASMFAGKE